ncbi:MAG: glycogen debranching enzyme GlgX [Verrucomicrobiaceae bacterium]|nr:MAG: glycogen debranching enzyme GlgX [Verrucomicrobiaceae bacterium]
MDERSNPTHSHGEFKLRYGHPLPFGSSHVPHGVNFSIFSAHATGCTLVLFERGAAEPLVEIPFPPEYRLGQVWAMTVDDLDYEKFDYGFRFEGPYDPREGHYFDPKNIVLDPHARKIAGREVWMGRPTVTPPIHRGRIPHEEFYWEHSRPLRSPESELIIYEMHVRGFTRHSSSGVQHPGTFEGIREKAAYFSELGVNCIELMPVFEFDECENTRTNPATGEPLCNYWGYSTVGFFAPKCSYAASAELGRQVHEFKHMMKTLHAEGVEVVLDVVFNHTAEGGADGPVISFRGIDNKTYYIIDAKGRFSNYTGCGNTVNCNHPAVRGFVISCLRYWAAEFHIDGFRFDLASVLGRDTSGAPLLNPPLLESLAYDPVLAGCDLIAEAWDAGGLYQVGNFPSYGRWMEWNGKFRDCVRRFLKGDSGMVGEMVQRIMGSPDLYAAAGRKPTASVNFITCHDGFTLRDLFTYNEKHNLENGENNNDGGNDNHSWNCGVEGETDDLEVRELRLRQCKNAMLLLLTSQGVPMIYMGDERGRAQRGNNNAYCHDEDWNWMNWDLDAEGESMLRFTKGMIAFRKANPALRQPEFLTGRDQIGSGYPDISWHGVLPWRPDWTASSRSLAFMLCGRHGEAAGGPPHFLYVAMNMFCKPLEFTLPVLPKGMSWHVFSDTGLPAPDDITVPGGEKVLARQKQYSVREWTSIILVGK